MTDFRVGDKVTWPFTGPGEYEIVIRIEEDKVLYFADDSWLEASDATLLNEHERYEDYFEFLVLKARERAAKAMEKFPQPNYVLTKVAEEHGEVIKGVVHYLEGREEWRNVENELIDNLAMLIRLLKEGDGKIGFTPPKHVMEKMR